MSKIKKIKKTKKSKSEAPPLKLKQTGTNPKIPVSIRLDEHIVTYFKAEHPRGYQSEINRVLSEYVAEQA